MKILLLGHGKWGQIILHDLLTFAVDVDVVEVDEKARDLAKMAGAQSTFSSLDALADLRAWDGIIIATPTSEHGMHIRQVWHAGVPIFCEKPLFATYPEFSALQDAPENLCLHVMHIWQQHPAVVAIADAIAAGRIGQLLTLRTERLGWTSPRRDVGAITNLLIHDLTIFDRLLQHRKFELKHADVERDEQGMDRWAQASFETAENQICSVEIGNRSPRKSRLIRAQGSEGVIWFDESQDNIIHLWAGNAEVTEGDTRKTTIDFESTVTAMQLQLRTWLDFLQGGPEPTGTMEQARQMARLAHQILTAT